MKTYHWHIVLLLFILSSIPWLCTAQTEYPTGSPSSSPLSISGGIACTNRLGGVSSVTGPSTSNVSCHAGETMVSCGYTESVDRVGGTIIDPITNVCTAYEYAGLSWTIQAVARCCTFPTTDFTTLTIQSTANESVSAQCPDGSTLTGCSYYLVSGSGNAVKGAFAGAQSSPPQTAAWISTGNQCNAEAKTGIIVQAIARCLSMNKPAYTLACETKATYTNLANFGTCQSGLQMLACAGFSPGGAIDRHYVTSDNTCYVQVNSGSPHYANAICCEVILTASPTSDPTPSPTNNPSVAPSIAPTNVPSVAPSASPSASPSMAPTQTLSPTNAPSMSPSHVPSASPSLSPSNAPSNTPSASPTNDPSITPTNAPSVAPSIPPTNVPSMSPTRNPSVAPSHVPSATPSSPPSTAPSHNPSLAPTIAPTSDPTNYPSSPPTLTPSINPTKDPTLTPSINPSKTPSKNPTIMPSNDPTIPPTKIPTDSPSTYPTMNPSMSPSNIPSNVPTRVPTRSPTRIPTSTPTHVPSTIPTNIPSAKPSITPSVSPVEPTLTPSNNPIKDPTVTPTIVPTKDPTKIPTDSPSTKYPTRNPTKVPTILPTRLPSVKPSIPPSMSPTRNPTKDPTMTPSVDTIIPSANPTIVPTGSPSSYPSNIPTALPTQIPTLFIPIQKAFTLLLNGNFGTFEQYLNDNNVKINVWAAEVIRTLLNDDNNPQLSSIIVAILNVRGGSIVIDYELESNSGSMDIIDVAEIIISSTQEVQTIGGFTFPVISNTVYMPNGKGQEEEQSKNDDTSIIWISTSVIILGIVIVFTMHRYCRKSIVADTPATPVTSPMTPRVGSFPLPMTTQYANQLMGDNVEAL
eukprot:793501_1